MYKLPDLPYKYDALEPYIDERTMMIHHQRHHTGYVNNLNSALKGDSKLTKLSVEELLQKTDKLPKPIKQTVINNGGGHANHSLYWKIMSPPSKDNVPVRKLKDAMDATFGDLQGFRGKFKEKAMSVFGSGWAFLVVNKRGKLELTRQSFQNSPLMYDQVPILGIDVWEHAYYLKYQNKRADYVDAFMKVINWKEVGKRFSKATK